MVFTVLATFIHYKSNHLNHCNSAIYTDGTIVHIKIFFYGRGQSKNPVMDGVFILSWTVLFEEMVPRTRVVY
jgi:hypothetical protein